MQDVDKSSDILFRDYGGGGRGNDIDFKVWEGSRALVINPSGGTLLNVGNHNQGNSSGFGSVRVFTELSVDFFEFQGSAVEGAKFFFEDFDGGNRRLYDTEAPNIDLTPTFSYSGTSISDGTTPLVSVLTGAVIADDSFGTASDAVNTGRYSWDYRSKNNNTDDLFDISYISYNHLLQSQENFPVKGLGGVSLSIPLFVDEVVSELDKSVVDAYTGFSVNEGTSTIALVDGFPATLEAIYDKAKAYKVDNFNNKFPSLSGLLVSSVGGRIKLGVSILDLTGFNSDFSSSLVSSLEIPPTATINIKQGTSNFTNFSFSAGATLSLASGSATVTVASDPGIVTAGGGTITIQTLQPTFSGFRTGNNINGVAYNSVVAIRNTNDSTLHTADASSGSYQVDLSIIGDGVGPFDCWADGVGFRRTTEVSIPASFTGNTDFSSLIVEYTKEDGTIIVGSESAASGLSYDEPNARFELAPGTYSMAGVVYQQELITSSQAGQAFDNSAVRSIEYIINDAYQRIIIPAAFSIAATEDAATSPIIQDFTVRRSNNTDPFEHGLPSTASGLTDRPEIIQAFVPLATGFDSTASTRLEELHQALESAGVFSTAALANATSGGGATAEATADAVLRELIADHSSVSGSLAESIETLQNQTEPEVKLR